MDSRKSDGAAPTLSSVGRPEELLGRVADLEQQLLDQMALDECVVLERIGPSGSRENVAYVVTPPGAAPDALVQRASADCLGALAAVVHLWSLPVTSSGEIDLAALARVPVRTRESETEWEGKLAALPEMGRVAALTGPWRRQERRLHRDDLLQSRSNDARSTGAETRRAIEPDQAEHGNDAPPALVEGARLPGSAGDARVLGDILYSAPRERPILYIRSDGTERDETYGSQLAAAERLLGGLQRLGIKPRDRVIFQLERPEDIIPLFWASLLGGVEVIIAPCPVSYGEESRALGQLQHIHALFERPFIITERARLEDFRSGTRTTPLAGARVASIEDLHDASEGGQLHAAAPDDVVLYALSSGSTGAPKAIALTHRNLIARALGVNAKCYSENDVVLNWLPFDHIGSISEGHLRPVVLGCKLIYTPKEYILARAQRLLDLIHRHRITHTWAPNFVYALVSSAIERERAASWDLTCVQMLLNAGELITTAAVQK
ncbi:MAG TPA: AMP-binding protein, partial [Candidatus Nanopelagicales bacterium]|nr:AMP-binding protein [Candidatus Nanopelagicales bacterium]